MTHTQQIVMDAVEGGWDRYKTPGLIITLEDEQYAAIGFLLDPDFWRAVGKTRGWRERSENTFEAEMSCWQAYWVGFYSHLADGKTIEEALQAISE